MEDKVFSRKAILSSPRNGHCRLPRMALHREIWPEGLFLGEPSVVGGVQDLLSDDQKTLPRQRPVAFCRIFLGISHKSGTAYFGRASSLPSPGAIAAFANALQTTATSTRTQVDLGERHECESQSSA